MKLNKLAYMLCLALAVGSASCSTDKEWEKDANSAAGTKVEFSASELSTKESKGVIQVPVVCSGDQNGRVTITVAVEPVNETGAIAAEENVNYIVTSKTVNIDADEQAAWVEFKAVDDDVINDPRKFKITITSAKGATIGDKASCVITIKDNDAEFYEKLMGNFSMTSKKSNGEDQTWKVKITGFDEGEDGYNEVLYVVGIGGDDEVQMQMNYHFDTVSMSGGLTIPYGTYAGGPFNFSNLGACEIYIGGIKDGRYIDFSGSTTATWSNDFNTITIAPNVPIYGFLVQNGKANGYSYCSFTNAVLTRTK